MTICLIIVPFLDTVVYLFLNVVIQRLNIILISPFGGFTDRNRRKKYVTQVQYGQMNGKCLLPKPANDLHGMGNLYNYLTFIYNYIFIIIYYYYIQINNLRARFTINVLDIQTHSKYTNLYEVNILSANDRSLWLVEVWLCLCVMKKTFFLRVVTTQRFWKTNYIYNNTICIVMIIFL